MDPKANDTAPATEGGALAALERKFSTKLSEGGSGKKIQRRKGFVTITPDMCEPDTFDQPFEIGLEGLGSQDELDSLRGATDGTSAGFEMAKRALRTLDGVPMRKHQKELVWECLGFIGRTQVVNAYLVQCTGAKAADLGNSPASTEG